MSLLVKSKSALFSPAYPALLLLYGMLFLFATTHFMAVSWSEHVTETFYMVLLGWVSVLAWWKRQYLRPVNLLDMLFITFILLVSASLVFQGGFFLGGGKFASYLPFMVVIPYLCGRLMREADNTFFMSLTLITGVAILPLLVLDRFISPGRSGGHWPFFGQSHGALLVGALLAAALTAICVRVLGRRNSDARSDRLAWCVYLVVIVTIFLVWVSARGWLLAGLVAVTVTCLSARHRLIITRLGLLAAVLAVAGITVASLPRLDPASGMIYAVPLIQPNPLGTRIQPNPLGTSFSKVGPFFGEESCLSFKGVNSVTIRRVLLSEAAAMFMAHPLLGVGATRFGERSCVGPGGYPHSTVLQAYAELGLVGGGLLTALLTLAAVTFVRPFLTVRQGPNWTADAFVLALFAMFLVGDQIYGNYFMSVGAWLMLGIAASMRSHDKQGCVSHG